MKFKKSITKDKAGNRTRISRIPCRRLINSATETLSEFFTMFEHDEVKEITQFFTCVNYKQKIEACIKWAKSFSVNVSHVLDVRAQNIFLNV